MRPAYQGDGRRAWLLAVQLYAVRSRRNWGHGDFTDLAAFRLALGGPSATPFIAYNPAFDADGDGDVDFTDLAQFRLRLGTTLP